LLTGTSNTQTGWLLHLQSAKLRLEVDARNERMNGKIRDAQMRKVPYTLVGGDREAQARAAAVRVRGGSDLGAMPLVEIVEKLRRERDTKWLGPGVQGG
jgi:threonyl-tRNA synthetase